MKYRDAEKEISSILSSQISTEIDNGIIKELLRLRIVDRTMKIKNIILLMQETAQE